MGQGQTLSPGISLEVLEYLVHFADRFGMCHPARVHGLVLINITASASLGRFMDTLKVINNISLLL